MYPPLVAAAFSSYILKHQGEFVPRTGFNNTPLTSPQMHDSWKPTMRDIALWLVNRSNHDQHKCGHVIGQGATAKSVVIPPLLRDALRDVGSNVPILHAMPEFKKTHVTRSRSNEAGYGIRNADYGQVTGMLKRALQPSG